MGPSPHIRAWRPQVSGVVEVLHAYFPDHAYPVHTHDAWTLLIVDDGVVRYDLDRHEHGALRPLVTLLPPHVPHDGRSVTAAGFRKRVIYLDETWLSPDLVGPAVDQPGIPDPVLRDRIDHMHEALRHPGDEFEAESRLALIIDRLREQLSTGIPDTPSRGRDRGVAVRLREMIDASVVAGVRLDDASRVLGATPTHLVRAFSREFGVPPHLYLTGRRLDDARRMLLAGHSSADVATAVGFYDQSHLTRHFRRMLGVAPATYAASAFPSRSSHSRSYPK
jgi:AraC-like DNA-binding protein